MRRQLTDAARRIVDSEVQGAMGGRLPNANAVVNKVGGELATIAENIVAGILDGSLAGGVTTAQGASGAVRVRQTAPREKPRLRIEPFQIGFENDGRTIVALLSIQEPLLALYNIVSGEADYILANEALSLGNMNVLVMRIINASDSSLLAGENMNYQTVENIAEQLPQIAARLATRTPTVETAPQHTLTPQPTPTHTLAEVENRSGGILSIGNMSAGVQVTFKNNFGGGVEYSRPNNSMGWSNGVVGSIEMPHAGGGLNAFFDIKYAEFSLGLTFGNINSKYSQYSTYSSGNRYAEWENERKYSFTSLDFGLLGKYPVDLGNMAIFPAVGIEYQLRVGGHVSTDYERDYWGNIQQQLWEYIGDDISRLWFKFGGGLDFSLSDAMFLRATFLYGIGLTSKAENNFVYLVDNYEHSGISLNQNLESADRISSHGFDIRVGIGYRF